jgi:hypothetical protein
MPSDCAGSLSRTLQSVTVHSHPSRYPATIAEYTTSPTMATTTALLLAALLLPLLILLWVTESKPQRARRLRGYGWTQQRIADHLGVSRSTARRLLLA